MSQAQNKADFTLEVARQVKDRGFDAGPDGERLLQLIDEVKRLRADSQARAADLTDETAYTIAQRIASKLGLPA
jgi:hypothetical protein